MNVICDDVMKVLLVTPSYFPIVGGSEALTRAISIKLNETGIHTDIMTLNMNKKWKPIWKEETGRDGPIRVFKVPAFNPFPGSPNPLLFLLNMNVVPKPSFVGKLREYDIIHFIGEADLGLPLFSHFIRRPKLMHCVGVYRDFGIYWYYRSRRPFLGEISLRIFLNLADIYVVSSAEEKELLLELGLPSSKILVLPIGVDVKVFRPDEKRKIDNLLLFVGRIERIKGVHILIEALSYLKTPTQLAIIGPRWEEEYVKELEQLSQAMNKDGVHTVRLLGSMDQSDLVPWYQRASILVSPYLYETYTMVVREALATGTPVVSTGTHIMKDDGILVTQKDPRRLAEAIKKLLEDKEMREEYGRKGRKLIEQNFSWRSIIDKLTKAYKEMLEIKLRAPK